MCTYPFVINKSNGCPWFPKKIPTDLELEDWFTLSGVDEICGHN